MSSKVQDHIEILNAQTPRNQFLTTANGSSIAHVPMGGKNAPAYTVVAEQSTSLAEQPSSYSVQPFTTVPSSALQGGGASIVDFKIPAHTGIMTNVVANMSVFNSSMANTHLWELPVLPFQLRRVQILQGSTQVGLDILPDQIWKYYGYSSTLNELTILQNTTGIDRNTYANSGKTIPANSTRVYSIDLAPLLSICQARVCCKYCDEITLRFYIEDISVTCPTNTNTTNAGLQLANMTLTITERVMSNEHQKRLANDYKRGPVSGRAIEYKQELQTINCVAGSDVMLSSNSFNNEKICFADVGIRPTNQVGANMISYADVSTLYLTTVDGVNLHNGLTPSSSDWLNVFYPQIFPDNIFTQQMKLFPVLVGSTDVKQTLKKAKQLGFTVFPNRAVIHVTATATASKQLQIAVFCYREVRTTNGKIMVY